MDPCCGTHGTGSRVGSALTCGAGSDGLARILAAVAAVGNDPSIIIIIGVCILVPCLLFSKVQVSVSSRCCAAWELEGGAPLPWAGRTRLRCALISNAGIQLPSICRLLAIAELSAGACTLLPRAVAVFQHSVRRLVDVKAPARLRIQDTTQVEGPHRRMWYALVGGNIWGGGGGAAERTPSSKSTSATTPRLLTAVTVPTFSCKDLC